MTSANLGGCTVKGIGCQRPPCSSQPEQSRVEARRLALDEAGADSGTGNRVEREVAVRQDDAVPSATTLELDERLSLGVRADNRALEGGSAGDVVRCVPKAPDIKAPPALAVEALDDTLLPVGVVALRADDEAVGGRRARNCVQREVQGAPRAQALQAREVPGRGGHGDGRRRRA